MFFSALGPWICQTVYKAKIIWLEKLSELLLICRTFQIRVVHLFGMLKNKSRRNINVYCRKEISPRAYLIWAPKLDAPKIGIPLSKWTQNIPWQPWDIWNVLNFEAKDDEETQAVFLHRKNKLSIEKKKSLWTYPAKSNSSNNLTPTIKPKM